MSSPPPSAASTRNVGLDLLRLVAVILVLFHHVKVPLEAFPTPVVNLLQILHRGGWVGVDLFFVLSGFLVSGLLFEDHRRHGHAALGNFLIRRGFKIYPAFWALFAYTCAVALLKKQPLAANEVLGELLFLQNYLGLLWSHTWSLAVEEHFYLGLAGLVALLQRRSVKNPFQSIPKIFLGVAITCLALRVLEVWRHPKYDWYQHLAPTHLRVDSLFFGVLLAYATRYHNLLERLRGFSRWLRFGLGTALLIPPFLLERNDHRWITVVGFNLLYLGAGLLLLSVVESRSRPGWFLRMLAALGATSYSIYLWHVPINQWAERLAQKIKPWPEATYLLLYFGGALAGGWLMARLIEFPVLRFRDRYFRSRTAAPANAAVRAQHPPEVDYARR